MYKMSASDVFILVSGCQLSRTRNDCAIRKTLPSTVFANAVLPLRQEEGNEKAEAGGRDLEHQVQAGQPPPPGQAQLPHQALQTSLSALQGALPGGHQLSPAELAAIQQQHTALMLQAQQAQQDFASEQREKG